MPSDPIEAADPVQAACSAQWQAERADKNQYDAMSAAIAAYLRAEAEKHRPRSIHACHFEFDYLTDLAAEVERLESDDATAA